MVLNSGYEEWNDQEQERGRDVYDLFDKGEISLLRTNYSSTEEIESAERERIEKEMVRSSRNGELESEIEDVCIEECFERDFLEVTNGNPEDVIIMNEEWNTFFEEPDEE
jgi:hypothetical protein